jgi:general secretion pathway protein K
LIEAKRGGVILVTVLWSIALLSTLVMATSLTFRGFVGIVTVDRDRLKADGLLTAGLEVAAGLASSADQIPLYDVESTVTLSSGAVRFRIDDEGGRIDIGKAPVEVLAALFASIGTANPDAIAQRIVEWRKLDDAASGPAAKRGADVPNVELVNVHGNADSPNAGPNTAPVAAPAKTPVPESALTSVADLRLLPEIRPEWVAAIAPLTTVFGNETVNPLTAPPAVLAALPGIDRARIAAFLDARRQPMEPQRLVGLLGGAQKYLDVKPLQAVSVHLTAALTDGYAAEANVVIVCLNGDRRPYRVLAWTPALPPL